MGLGSEAGAMDRPDDRAIRQLRTADLGLQGAALRALLDAAWGGNQGEFSDDDWRSATGGIHFVLEIDGAIVSHASVVERVLETGGLELRTGYVEAVATSPEHRRRGYASQIMRAVASFIDERYELGALGTGLFDFYGRLGWESWRGPTSMRTDRGIERTPDEDGFIMVRRTPATPPDLDLDALLTCDWRPGDVW